MRAKRHELDGLACVAVTNDRSVELAFSDPYLDFYRVIITRTEKPFLTGLEDLSAARVAVQANSSHEGYLKEHSHLQPIPYPTLKAALQAVSEGDADAMVGNVASATYWIRMQHLTNLKIAAPVSRDIQKLHVAIRADWPMLVTIINKGLASISLSKEAEIRRHWINVEYNPGINPVDFWKYIIRIIGVAILIMVMILAWNYRQKQEIRKRRQIENELEQRVADRTRDLADANACLQQEINDRRKMEDEKERLSCQLMQAQKMEAIGTMAGGIAHDFNNILMPIIGYAEMVQRNLPAGSQDREYLQQILAGSMRAKDLVKQILTFSRHADHEAQPVELGSMVAETLKLIRSSLPATIQIETEIASGAGAILGSPTQIHQLLMNLCTNAYHAMRDTGGTLTVTLDEVDIDATASSEGVMARQGRSVRLRVSDTGHGIDPKIQDRILEPYFTTKASDEGTGLGLSVVHGIVEKHGGHLTYFSEPYQETVFQILLPKLTVPDATPALEQHPRLIGGTESIWVLDDDPVIVQMEQKMLEELGYAVRAFTRCDDLTVAFNQNGHDVDLIITDMTMPQKTGVALAREILALQPDIPFVLCTGFSEQIDEPKAKALGIRAYLMKPVIMRDLAETVRSVLSSR